MRSNKYVGNVESQRLHSISKREAIERGEWFRMTVDAMNRPQGGAVIGHLDITNTQSLEAEQARAMEEVAHMNRVATMGHMTASLAHELAQPLATILSNTQAAERYASASEPNIFEIRAALADIREDDKRAGAVLQNIRSILKKKPVTPHEVDLNDLVQDVAGFVRNDALFRGVQLKMRLAPLRITIQGDEVPLQQVMLNLINNGYGCYAAVTGAGKDSHD